MAYQPQQMPQGGPIQKQSLAASQAAMANMPGAPRPHTGPTQQTQPAMPPPLPPAAAPGPGNPAQPGVNNSMKEGSTTNPLAKQTGTSPAPGAGMGAPDSFNDFMSGTLSPDWQKMMAPTDPNNPSAGYGEREENVKKALADAFKKRFGADPTVGMSYDPWGQSNPAQATKRMQQYFDAARTGQGQVVGGKFYTNDQIAKYGMPKGAVTPLPPGPGGAPAAASQAVAPQAPAPPAPPAPAPAQAAQPATAQPAGAPPDPNQAPLAPDQTGGNGGMADMLSQLQGAMGGGNLGAGFGQQLQQMQQQMQMQQMMQSLMGGMGGMGGYGGGYNPYGMGGFGGGYGGYQQPQMDPFQQMMTAMGGGARGYY